MLLRAVSRAWRSATVGAQPKNGHYFPLFTEEMEIIVEAASAVVELSTLDAEDGRPETPLSERREIAARIIQLRTDANRVHAKLRSSFRGTWGTPPTLTRAETGTIISSIHILSNRIGEIGSIYKTRHVKTPPKVALAIALSLKKSVEILAELVPRFRETHLDPTIGGRLDEIDAIESEVDDLFDADIARLFETEEEFVRLDDLRTKAFLSALEKAEDSCLEFGRKLIEIFDRHA